MEKAKEVIWLASSRKDLREFPQRVRGKFGQSLWEVQRGFFPSDSKVLQGFGGATVFEIRSEYEGNAYRAVYTVRFAEFVYVLHVFQKKSKKGTKTPANIIELVRKRLKSAKQHYENWKTKKQDASQS
jgi:phage-related protein